VPIVLPALDRPDEEVEPVWVLLGCEVTVPVPETPPASFINDEQVPVAVEADWVVPEPEKSQAELLLS
jgi:hypothetical protein